MKDWGKVFIATRYQPMLPAWTCESLIGLVQFGMRAGDVRDCIYSKTMHKAANMLVRKLLESDCDSICFIDSDAVFGSGALEELRSDPEGWEYDVLQAFTVKRGWPPEPMFLTEMPEQPQGPERVRGRHLVSNLPLEGERIYPVDAVSLHFTLIRRELFERMVDPEFGPKYTYWFQYHNDGGEDVNFSYAARGAGARLGMSTRLKVGHVGEIVTGWDTMVDYYDRKFAVEEGAPPASLARFAPYFEARKQLALLLAEWNGEDPEEIYQRANAGGGPVADKWEREKPETPEQVRAFYGNTPAYLYDLIRWNTSPAYQKLLGDLVGVRGEQILEIGGGLGTTAEFLVTRGNRVDYYDVPGVLLDFAAWRFGRLPPACRENVAIVQRWPEGAYDRVIALDVLEHVHPAEIGVLLYGLAGALRPGGTLFVHNNWSTDGGAHPMHFDHSQIWAEFLAAYGFERVNDWTWRKPATAVAAEIDLDDAALRDEMTPVLHAGALQ